MMDRHKRTCYNNRMKHITEDDPMKMQSRLILLFLICSLMLSACGGAPAAETAGATAASTEAPAEIATEPVETLPPDPVIAETVFPKGDEATGTLHFYLNDKAVYAGGPVSDIIEAGISTHDDLSAMVEPGHMSATIRVQVEIEGAKKADKPYIFFVAVNPYGSPRMISECLIYSLTVNCERGIAFGSGKEAMPFTTYETTRDDITAAYGEPDYAYSRRMQYEEIAYYEPFSCAYFSFENDKVRQISTYYSRNIFHELADNVTLDLDTYFGLDCYLLMCQYMDVTSYLEEKEETEKTGEATDESGTGKTEQAGVLKKLSEEIKIDGKTVTLGCEVSKMPAIFSEHFEEIIMPVARHYYIRAGRNTKEEFFFINDDGQPIGNADELEVKGIITENRNYDNWGIDNSEFYNFNYEGITEDFTINQILEKYGQPMELHCTSNGRFCFAWLHYEDENGNTLRLRVDPILNELVEIRVSKFFEDESPYV